MRYKKKPIEVEVVKFDGTNYREVLEFIYPDMTETGLVGAEKMKLPIVIETLEGDMNVSVGDYVIRGVQGEFYPCKPDIFEQTYQIISKSASGFSFDLNTMKTNKGGVNMNFEEVLPLLKQGKKALRSGWNGKGMFVVRQKGYPEGIKCNKQTAEAWNLNEGDLFKVNPYLQIKNADGTHAMWVPSIGDIFAEDWEIVE